MKRVADDCWEFEYTTERVTIYGMPEALRLTPNELGAYISGLYEKKPEEA